MGWHPWIEKMALELMESCLLREQCQCRGHGFGPWVGKIPWSRKWQSTPVFLPGKSHGQRSLVGHSPWGRRELDTTEHLSTHATSVLCVIHKSISKISRKLRHSPRPRIQTQISNWLTNPSNSTCFTNLGSFLTNLVFFTIHILPVPQERTLSPSWLLLSNHSLSSPFLWIFTLWMPLKFTDTGRDGGKKEKRESEDSWVASPMQWTWTWANSGRWWGTGRLGMLQSTESQTWLGSWTTTTTFQISSVFQFSPAPL